jgi:glycosyltransferase involved in cell wall biosynthesis
MSTPLLSVCLITYNHVKYIREAIDGVLMQKVNFSWELIIADDFSTDGTREIVLNYKEKYPEFIKLILQEKNVGATQNWFDLLNAPASKYIAYFEGDDYWIDPLKLQKQVDFLEQNDEYGLIFTDVDIYYQELNIFERSVFHNNFFPVILTFREHLINSGFLAPCTWLCRKQYVPIDGNRYFDGTFPWMLDVLANSKIKYLDEVTAVYRLINESASHSKSIRKRYLFSKGVFQTQKDYLEKYNQPNELKKLISCKEYSMLLPSAIALNDKELISEASDFFKLNISSLKEKLLILFSQVSLTRFIFLFLYKIRGFKN